MRIAVPSKSNALGCAYDIVTRNPGFAEAMKFEKELNHFVLFSTTTQVVRMAKNYRSIIF